MTTKKQLTLTLQDLALFTNPKLAEEQYATPANIAADLLWKAFMLGDIEDKELIDLGCGTGILGIGALLLGAKSCIFLEKDEEALDLCRRNLNTVDMNEDNYIIINEDVRKTELRTDTCIANPPFGTKVKHADRIFLEKSMRSSVVYFFHKTSTTEFIEGFVSKQKKKITHHWLYRWPLKASMRQHHKRIEYIEVSVARIV